MQKIRFGILSTSQFAQRRTIPSLQQGIWTTVTAISSRDGNKAQEAASRLSIPKWYDSHEAMLADPDVDAIYNPTPNHQHIPLTIQALEAGKHVLCEKPLAMNAGEVEKLIEVMKAFPNLKVMEGFMYRFHPHTLKLKSCLAQGKIGEPRIMHGHFSYFNTDPKNVRHVVEWGGGGLLDIGCYCISMARWLFDAEPVRVSAVMENDPQFKTDRLASALLDFGDGKVATFNTATQTHFMQRFYVVGTEGTLETHSPFPAPEVACSLRLTKGSEVEEIPQAPIDGYIFQGDAFAQAILNDTPVPISIADSLANMRVLDAVKRSAESGSWAMV